MEAFRQSGIDRYADMAGLAELAEQLARCTAVMAYDSTVLWEAYILGLVPVSVLGNCYRGTLSFPHEVVDITSTIGNQLEHVLHPRTVEKYRLAVAQEVFDWEAIIMGLLGEMSPVNSQAGIVHPDSFA